MELVTTCGFWFQMASRCLKDWRNISTPSNSFGPDPQSCQSGCVKMNTRTWGQKYVLLLTAKTIKSSVDNVDNIHTGATSSNKLCLCHVNVCHIISTAVAVCEKMYKRETLSSACPKSQCWLPVPHCVL